MKDISSLYRTAKYSGREADISSYREAVNQLLENSPMDYILQLEYIIQSNIGLSTVKPFIEKYGLAIPVCDQFLEAAEECCAKAEKKGIPHKKYDELVELLEQFKETYSECFSMFNFYSSDNPDVIKEYVETYYGMTGCTQNRMIATGMIKKFHEMAIPDLLINANQINENAVVSLLNEVSNDKEMMNPAFCEYVKYVIGNMNMPTHGAKIQHWFESHGVTPIVDQFRDRVHREYRESVIMGDFDHQIQFTEADVNNILALIMINESVVIGMSDKNAAQVLQEKIYSLYQDLDGYVTESGDIIEEDVADSVIPMLPNSTGGKAYSEDLSWANTMNKKKGTIPGYLADNHDLASVGEEDDENKSPEDYRRPSADGNTPDSDGIQIDGEDDGDDNIGDPEEDDDIDRKKSSSVNNYYYYTYTNSLNRNQNSFNRDNNYSHHDDHRRYQDDHSVKHDNHSKENHSIRTTTVLQKPDSDEEIKTEATTIVDGKPESDHPVRDTLMDIDRRTTALQQKAKKGVQNIQNVGRAFMKPIKRTDLWISKMVGKWKDSNENNIKERMADPHARKNLYSTIKGAIVNGSLLKAGLLLNPIFLFLRISKNKDNMRIRNEMIGELKTEIAICDEKIRDCPDTPEGHRMKYKTMRFKNELNKKLLRVGGGKGMAKII